MQSTVAVFITFFWVAFWIRGRPSVVVFSLSASTPRAKKRPNRSSPRRANELDVSRRSMTTYTCLVVGAAASGVALKSIETSTAASLRLVVDKNDFQGTLLPLLSLEQASALSFRIEEETDDSAQVFPFAQWPDPLLRRPASRVSIVPLLLSMDEQAQARRMTLAAKLQSIARILQKTAREKGAVGLAAQQCGIDVSMVYLGDLKENNSAAATISGALQKLWTGIRIGPKDGAGGDGGIFLLNPRIVNRSREEEMLVWTEECLVLPPWFRATVLRDSWVTIEYESIFPTPSNNQNKNSASTADDDDDSIFVTKQITLHGELARAAQHEMQHDEGILILDHVDLTDLPAFMQGHEAQGHNERMQRAFSRAVIPSSTGSSTLNVATSSTTPSFSKLNEAIVPKAHAAAVPVIDNNVPPVLANNPEVAVVCNDACLAERKRVIEERRAMMRQSRSNTNRQDVFRLSQQRAALYNTTYQGAQCQPGVPCI